MNQKLIDISQLEIYFNKQFGGKHKVIAHQKAADTLAKKQNHDKELIKQLKRYIRSFHFECTLNSRNKRTDTMVNGYKHTIRNFLVHLQKNEHGYDFNEKARILNDGLATSINYSERLPTLPTEPLPPARTDTPLPTARADTELDVANRELLAVINKRNRLQLKESTEKESKEKELVATVNHLTNRLQVKETEYEAIVSRLEAEKKVYRHEWKKQRKALTVARATIETATETATQAELRSVRQLQEMQTTLDTNRVAMNQLQELQCEYYEFAWMYETVHIKQDVRAGDVTSLNERCLRLLGRSSRPPAPRVLPALPVPPTVHRPDNNTTDTAAEDSDAAGLSEKRIRTDADTDASESEPPAKRNKTGL